MSKRRRKQKDLTKHHVCPRSKGGSSKLENIAMVTLEEHQKYHTLFFNKTPGEIIETLVNKYWNGRWDYVADAYDRNNGIHRTRKPKL